MTFFKGGLLKSIIQHCFICRPSGSTFVGGCWDRTQNFFALTVKLSKRYNCVLGHMFLYIRNKLGEDDFALVSYILHGWSSILCVKDFVNKVRVEFFCGIWKGNCACNKLYKIGKFSYQLLQLSRYHITK